jgi:hypothetical protein
MLAEYDHKAFGRVRSIGLPLAMTDLDPSYRPAPSLGGDGADLLEELRFPADWLSRVGGTVLEPDAGETAEAADP